MLGSVCVRSARYASCTRTMCLTSVNLGNFVTTLKNGLGQQPQVNSEAKKTKAVKDKVYKSTIDEIYMKIVNRGAGVTFGVGDLTRLLNAWGRSDNTDVNQTKHLNDLEMLLIPQLETLNVHRTVSLLYAYARVGRKFAPIMNVLNKTIENKLVTPVAGETPLLPKRLLEALWSNAQLNDHTSYLPQLISMCVAVCKEDGKTTDLCEVLLSLAILQKLDLPTFMSAKDTLEQAVTNNGLDTVNVAQLRHVWNEVQILMKEQGIDPVQWQQEQILKATHAQDTTTTTTSAMKEVFDAPRALLPWQVGYSETNANTPQSSHNHVALSHALRAMGVPHKNEVTLTNGLIADILIPSRAFVLDAAECKGVVVEYDGPFHFESYAKVALLLLRFYLSCSIIAPKHTRSLTITDPLFRLSWAPH